MHPVEKCLDVEQPFEQAFGGKFKQDIYWNAKALKKTKRWRFCVCGKRETCQNLFSCGGLFVPKPLTSPGIHGPGRGTWRARATVQLPSHVFLAQPTNGNRANVDQKQGLPQIRFGGGAIENCCFGFSRRTQCRVFPSPRSGNAGAWGVSADWMRQGWDCLGSAFFWGVEMRRRRLVAVFQKALTLPR